MPKRKLVDINIKLKLAVGTICTCLLETHSSEVIMEEEDDDFYAPNDDTPGVPPSDTNAITPNPPPALKQEKIGDDLEEGEEEGEEVEVDESDSVSSYNLRLVMQDLVTQFAGHRYYYRTKGRIEA